MSIYNVKFGKKRIRVLIVDDSAVVRQTMKDILSHDREIEVMGVAADPIFAMKKIENDIPDVILLDIEMPRMDGITFLKKIMKHQPIPVIVCSSKAGAGSDNALKVLDAGAIEIIQKPQLGTKIFIEESKVRICDAVKAAHLSRNKLKQFGKRASGEKLSMSGSIPSFMDISPKLTADVILAKPKYDSIIETTEKVVVVGASTGGTEAIRIFLEAMPLDAPGIVIVQHMPEHFTTAFSKRLNNLCRVSVKEAEDNDTVIKGRVLIAPGNKHALLKRSGARYYVQVKDGPLVCRHRPSVDVLFRSAARYAGKNTIGVIMTGMGDDGARAMAELKLSGAYNIAQDEKSCIVFGMPNEAIKRGGVDKVTSLNNIANMVLREYNN